MDLMGLSAMFFLNASLQFGFITPTLGISYSCGCCELTDSSLLAGKMWVWRAAPYEMGYQ